MCNPMKNAGIKITKAKSNNLSPANLHKHIRKQKDVIYKIYDGSVHKYKPSKIRNFISNIFSKMNVYKENTVITEAPNNKLLFPIRRIPEAETLVLNTHLANLTSGFVSFNILYGLLNLLFKKQLIFLPAEFALYYATTAVGQMHAIDVIGVNKDNLLSSKITGTQKLENYYIYGVDVVACADGQVVDINNDADDLAHGMIDTLKMYTGLSNIAGNYVILKHTDDTFSIYGHLKKDSIRVNPGQYVKAGEALGKVGNTGNSSEPHLHFQLCKINPKYTIKTAVLTPITLWNARLENFEDHKYIPIGKNTKLDVMKNLMTISNDKIKDMLDSGYKNNKSGKIHEFCFLKVNNNIKESVITEAKDFPIQFDNSGNLLIAKSGDVDFEEEYSDSHKLLLAYEKSNNLNGMKYELCKLWYLNSLIERKIYAKGDKSKDLYKVRARILNDFNKYLAIVNEQDKGFNFREYYSKTPFDDATIKVRSSTIKHTAAYIKNILKL